MRKISKENQRFTRSIPRKLLSFSIALGLLTPLPQITNASADEWHGQLVMGRILETYKRLGGHHTFGNATTPYERNLETAGGSPKTSNTPNIENPTTGEVSTPPSGDSTLTSDAILTSEPDEVEPATQTTAPGTVQDNVILEPRNRREDLGTLQ